MNKKVIIGSLLCIAGFNAIFGLNTGLAFDFFSKSTVDEPLTSVSFVSGGDMQGSTHDMSVKAIDNTSAMVCFEDANWHNEAIVVQEYIVPASVLEDVKTIFNDNKLLRCEKAPKSKFMVLDAATSSYYFNFGKRTIRFYSYQELPDGSNQALREISKCVRAACEKGQRLPGLVLEKNKDGNMPLRTAVVKGQVAIKVVGYRNNYLQISIGNGTDEDKTVALKAKLVNLNAPENIVANDLTDETLQVSGHYNYDYSWKLPNRLEAGKYGLSLGAYNTEFEIR